jgi:hypothetical protein
VDRKKKHGLSYTYRVVKFMLGDDRPYRVLRNETCIEVNGAHPEYVAIEKSKGMFSKAARFYIRLMAVRALWEEIRRLNPDIPAVTLQNKETIYLSRAISQIELEEPRISTKKEAITAANKASANPPVKTSEKVAVAQPVKTREQIAEDLKRSLNVRVGRLK